jgi:hypothetical protein
MQTRTAQVEDAENIALLVNAAFRPERFFIDADRTNPAKVRELLQKGKFLLSEEAGALAGCIYVELRGDRGYFACSRSIRHCNGQVSDLGSSRLPRNTVALRIAISWTSPL